MNKKQAKEFIKALDAIVLEKGIDRQIIIDAMEQALAAAYKKNTGVPQAKAKVNSDTGEMRVFTYLTVVENVENPDIEISLEDAKKIDEDIQVGETIDTPVEMGDFSRVAAGTAKQIVVQKVKEAEKNNISEEFKDKEGELVVGTLEREDANTYYVNLGRTFGILPKDEIIPGEQLVMGSSIKAYVSKLEIGSKGVFILLSRKHYGFLKRLLELEIPELSDGTVILYSVAREAGLRSKIAVYSDYENVEPLGAVIGEKGTRISRVLKQLNGEKIDVIAYDKDPIKFIQNALSPAKDVKVTITNEKAKEAQALVNDQNLSLAIGKRGQNVKLASRLTHFKIDVKSENEEQKYVL